MANTTTRTKSAKTVWGSGVRGRDAEFPSAPIRVSEHAQAKMIDVNAARQFDFGQRDRDRLPERPSTSGGPAANFSMRKNAEKRETRDDLHFNPLAAHGRGTTFYNFPLPGALPTPPATTPKSSPLPGKSSLPPSDTPESIDARPAVMTLQVQQTEIGMALGSPTHQPTSWQPHTPFESNSSPSPDIESSTDGWSHQPLPLKHKASKWKILGGLFGGGKKQNTSQAFYQLQPEATHQTTVESDYVEVPEPPLSSNEKKASKARSRGRTNSERKTEKNKPDMKRAKTAPLDFDFNRNGVQTPTPEITIDGNPMVDSVTHRNQSHAYHGGPLLNVDIPSVQMERYSVMFGGVLQKPVNSTTSSSLLARRQATLDRLKTVNEELALKERELEEKARLLRPRRATSPQPTKSPAFSLFPQTPSRLTVRDASPSISGPRSALQRSNTSPAALSPSRPSFTPQSDNEVHATLMGPGPHIPINIRSEQQVSSQQKHEPKVPAKQSATASPKPQQVNRNWTQEESHLVLNSPGSEIEEKDVYDHVLFPMRPKLEEPDWQMIPHHTHSHKTPSSVSDSISSRSEGHSTSTSASSITTSTPHIATPKHVQIQAPPATRRNRSATTSSATRPRPSEVSNAAFGSPSPSLTTSTPKTPSNANDEDTEEQRLKSAADISIARQISVSRQQRQLLIPIKKAASLNNKINPNFPSPSPLNIARTASPLGVVAAAAESPVAGRSGSPFVRAELKRMNTNERLVLASGNPSTPTLVLVDNGKISEVERSWGGAMAASSPMSAFSGTGSGEIKVGLAIGSPVEMGNRKSERVVVERVGG